MQVGVVGLGLIGSYVAIRLSAAGVPVRAAGRRDLLPETIAARRAYDLRGESYIQNAPLRYHRHPIDVHGCDLILVAVKSSASEAIRDSLPSGVPIVSLQNGLDNPARLQAASSRHQVYGGVVTFNVRRGGGPSDPFGPDAYVQTTSGPIVLAARSLGEDAPHLPAHCLAALRATGLVIKTTKDFDAAARAKLLLNLNNGVCAAAGVSVADSIRDQRLRRVYAACIREGLAVFRARKERVGRIGPLAPGLIARFLPLSDRVVALLARPMIQIDPRARSSTLVDLEAGRITEISELNGSIRAAGEALSIPCPANAAVEAVVRALEVEAQAARPLSHIGPDALLRRVWPQ